MRIKHIDLATDAERERVMRLCAVKQEARKELARIAARLRQRAHARRRAADSKPHR